MNRKELVDKLSTVGNALSKLDLVPVYKCFAFDGQSVMAYNDIIGIISPCAIEFSFAVDGRMTIDLLSASKSETVTIELKDDDIVFTVGKSIFKLPHVKKENFIFEIPRIDYEMEILIDKQFIAGLSACMLTASQNNAHPALLGVTVTPHKDGTTLYSTDGDAITQYDLTWIDRNAKSSFMLPNQFCEALQAILDKFEAPPEDGFLRLSKEWAQAEIGEYTLYGRMIINPTPLDFADQIESTLKGEPEFIAIPKGLFEALSRARIVADPVSGKTELTVSGKTLKIETSTHLGVVKDTISIAAHPPVTAAVSAELVQRSLKLAKEIHINEGYCLFISDNYFVILANME